MKKQFIYDNKGKKTAVIILMDEWNDIKKRLKKKDRKEQKLVKSNTAKTKKIVTPVAPIIKPVTKKAAPKKSAIVKKK